MGGSVATAVLAQSLVPCRAGAGGSRVVMAQLEGNGVGGLKHHSWIAAAWLGLQRAAG